MTLRSFRASAYQKLLFAPFLVVTTAAGCGGLPASPRRGGGLGLFGGGDTPDMAPRPPQGNEVRAEPLADEPSAALGQVAAHLQRRGFTAAVPPRAIQVPPTGTTTVPLSVEYGRCYVVVAIGPKERNVDLVLLDPWGRSIAHDLRPDRHPWAAFCPSTNGRHTVRLQAPPGTPTAVQFAVFRGGPTQNPALAAFFQAAEGGGAAPVRTVGVPPSLAPRLASYTQRFVSEGYQQGGPPMAVVTAAGQGVDFEVNLPSPGCFRMVLVGTGAGIQRLQAVLMNPQGQVLTRAGGMEADAVLEHCVQAPGKARLRALPLQGSGPLAVAFFSRTQAGSTSAGSPEGSETTGGIAGAQSAGGVEEQFAFVDGDMRTRGYTRTSDPQRLHMMPGEKRPLSFDLEAGKCYAFLAVGDPATVQDVDLWVGSPSREVLDMDVATDARPIVRVCPRKSGPHTVLVTMADGQGEILFTRYDWPRGVRGPFGLRGLAYVRLAENVALLASEDYLPDDNLTPIRSRFRKLDEVRTHRLNLKGGRCYALLVVGGEGIRLVSGELEVGGSVVDRTPPQHIVPFSTLRHCPEQDVRATLRVQAPALSTYLGGAVRPEMESRPGTYVVQVFRRRP